MKIENKVYLLTQVNDEFTELWHQSPPQGMQLTTDKSAATVVLGEPPMLAKQLDEFPNMQWFQSTFAGVDRLFKEGLAQNYQLTKIKDIFGQLISEYVIGYIYGHFRHLFIYHEQQKQSLWKDHLYSSLIGKKVLILGTGSIGKKVACHLTHLGFVVSGVNTRGNIPANSQFKHCYTLDELNQGLAQADIIINALPNTPQTDNILNETSLSHCQSALLFNIGRGNAVQESGLLLALEKQWIEHAFLDVFPIEPLPSSSPYWQHPNISITPHIAAISFSEHIYEIFKRNCQHWIAQQPLEYLVEWDKGY